MHTHHRVAAGRLRVYKYHDPRVVPDCVRYSRCVCGKILMIERVPDVLGSVWDCYCICGRRYPIPKGYAHDSSEI